MAGGRRKIELHEFIDSIPDAKLEGFPDSEKTLYHDRNFRLDMQGVRALVIFTLYRVGGPGVSY